MAYKDDSQLSHQEIFDRNPLNLDITGANEKNRILNDELKSFKTVFSKLANQSTGKVDATSVLKIYTKLGENISKKEVEKIIWEVDDDLDGGLDWREFITMCHRCIVDVKGTEPRRLYTLVQYMMFDTTLKGSVTVNGNDCLTLLFVRNGKEGLDRAVAEAFPLDASSSGAKLEPNKTECEVSFKDFMKAHAEVVVQKRNLKQRYAPPEHFSRETKTIGASPVRQRY